MPDKRPDQSVVRQYERLQCRLPAIVRVGEEHADQVALSRTVGDGTGVLNVDITDCSRGGMNIESGVFLPRGCRLRVTFTDGTHEHALLIRVQRVAQTARTPTYSHGTSFVGQGPTHEDAVVALLEAARSQTMGKGVDSKEAA